MMKSRTSNGGLAEEKERCFLGQTSRRQRAPNDIIVIRCGLQVSVQKQ